MRRRLLLLALWALGTVVATSLVFGFLRSLSTDLGTVSQEDRGSRGVAASRPETPTTRKPTVPTATAAETTTSADAGDAGTTTPEVASTQPDTTEPASGASPGGEATTVPRGGATPTALTAPRQTTPPVGPTTATTPAPPPVTSPPVTPAPPPATTVATTVQPTTAATVPSGAPCSTGVKTARRNSVFYRVCGSSVSLTGAVPAAGWSQGQVLSAGPPVVSVRFTQPSTGATVSCTVMADGDGIVTASGDC